MKRRFVVKLICILFSAIYIISAFCSCASKDKYNKTSNDLNSSYINKFIHKDGITVIEYTDKFSLEDTIINNIIMIDYHIYNQNFNFQNLIHRINNELNNELNNESFKNSNPELLLSNIYFYIVLLNKTTNINIAPELKNNICSFINTYYIERWNQFKEKDKLIKLDALEKISSLKDILNTSVNLKDFVLNSIQSIEFYHDNVNFDNETILFYKARILKNLNLTNEVSKIQKSINNATNNLFDNLTDDFINNMGVSH